MTQINELTDTDTGTYVFRTSTGSLYRLRLDSPRTLMRLPANHEPVESYQDVPTNALRLDGEDIPLLEVGTLKVGQRGALWLDIVGDGRTVTTRDTSEVVSIHRLQDERAPLESL